MTEKNLELKLVENKLSELERTAEKTQSRLATGFLVGIMTGMGLVMYAHEYQKTPALAVAGMIIAGVGALTGLCGAVNYMWAEDRKREYFEKIRELKREYLEEK